MTRLWEAERIPKLSDVGFRGGHENFRAFCAAIFTSDEPRFLKTEDDQLVVFRHADLRAFGAAPQVGNVPPGVLYAGRFDSAQTGAGLPGAEVARVIANQAFTANPPIHGPARKILTNWLGPKEVVAMEGLARETAQAIIDTLPEGAEIDFVSEFAETMTTNFWAAALHLSRKETDAIRSCVREMTRLFQLTRTNEDLAVLDRAFAEYARLLNGAAERGLAENDPLMAKLGAELVALDFRDDPQRAGIVPKSVGDLLAGNLVDGFHTAALASANAIYTLARHPEAMSAMRADPTLLPRAIAEALRVEPPVIFLKRYLLEDFLYEERTIRAGSQIIMLWAAGNHDPKAFSNPERFDLSRSLQGLTTFGAGIHICPGRHVAVMLARVLIETLESNAVWFKLESAAAAWIPDHMMAQLERLSLRVQRR
jgi:cytochrome P450